jgi:hypothetical protein
MGLLWLLIDPIVQSGLVCLDLAFLEPEGNLLLGILNTIGTVANIPARFDRIIPSYCSWLRSKGVGGTEEGCSHIR